MSKLMRRHQRKIARERQQQNRIDSSSFQQPQLFRERGKQFQTVIGSQNPGRVRLKSNHHRLSMTSLSPPHDLVQNMAMSAVDAIEVANADHRRPKLPRNVVEMVKDVHASF